MSTLRLTITALLCAAAVPLCAQAGARTAPPRAELIVTNARIYTADDAHPLAEAMAVSAGKVQFVGSTVEAMALRGPATRLIDAGGRTIIPGMTDAHAHLYGLGEVLQRVAACHNQPTTLPHPISTQPSACSCPRGSAAAQSCLTLHFLADQGIQPAEV